MLVFYWTLSQRWCVYSKNAMFVSEHEKGAKNLPEEEIKAAHSHSL